MTKPIDLVEFSRLHAAHGGNFSQMAAEFYGHDETTSFADAEAARKRFSRFAKRIGDLERLEAIAERNDIPESATLLGGEIVDFTGFMRGNDGNPIVVPLKSERLKYEMPGQNAAPIAREFKIAFLDIETAPNRGYTWGKYEQNVIEFDQEWYLLCFGVKWSGDEKTTIHAQPDFAGYDDDRTNDAQLAAKLWEVLDEADLVIAHNGDKFDLRKSNARFLAHGMTPPSPYKTVDTLKLARKHFALNSNKLDDVARILGVGKKAETGGFQLWLDCMAGDRKAWRKMSRYCAHDVDLLEAVYERLRPWHATHPNIAATSNVALACGSCGSENVQRRGSAHAAGKSLPRFQCLGCGKWSQGKAA